MLICPLPERRSHDWRGWRRRGPSLSIGVDRVCGCGRRSGFRGLWRPGPETQSAQAPHGSRVDDVLCLPALMRVKNSGQSQDSLTCPAAHLCGAGLSATAHSDTLQPGVKVFRYSDSQDADHRPMFIAPLPAAGPTSRPGSGDPVWPHPARSALLAIGKTEKYGGVGWAELIRNARSWFSQM